MIIRWRFLADILIRALIFLAAANVLFAWINPMPALGELSLYNRILPGRTRLPFSAQPDVSNNLTLYNLDAMFASHEIAAIPKPADEFRVVLIGDSSIWGLLLRDKETRTALLNARGLTAGGMRVRFYNIGYPTMSSLKDLLLLDRIMDYQPDMIMWTITLEALVPAKQISSSIVAHNPVNTRRLIAEYKLSCDMNDPAFVDSSFWDRTIFGRRRDLADLIWLQAKGFGWAATGVDTYIPEQHDRPKNDLTDETAYRGMEGPQFQPSDLSWDVLDAGREMTEGIPLLVINEPMFRAGGENSDIRYNSLYPRWAYDRYRTMLDEYTRSHGVAYVDLWDAIPADQFTDAIEHITPEAEQVVAQQIEKAVMMLIKTPEQE